MDALAFVCVTDGGTVSLTGQNLSYHTARDIRKYPNRGARPRVFNFLKSILVFFYPYIALFSWTDHDPWCDLPCGDIIIKHDSTILFYHIKTQIMVLGSVNSNTQSAQWYACVRCVLWKQISRLRIIITHAIGIRSPSKDRHAHFPIFAWPILYIYWKLILCSKLGGFVINIWNKRLRAILPIEDNCELSLT